MILWYMIKISRKNPITYNFNDQLRGGTQDERLFKKENNLFFK